MDSGSCTVIDTRSVSGGMVVRGEERGGKRRKEGGGREGGGKRENLSILAVLLSEVERRGEERGGERRMSVCE